MGLVLFSCQELITARLQKEVYEWLLEGNLSFAGKFHIKYEMEFHGKMKIIELTPGYDLALADLIRFNLKKHHLAYADYIQGNRTFLEVSEDYRRV